jgi:phage FluMu gp28-like protein
MNPLQIPEADTTYFLPYQLRWLDDNTPLKIMEKSRQIGMTYVDAYESVIKASSREAADVYVSSPDLVYFPPGTRSARIRASATRCE